MQSLWKDDEAREFIGRYGERFGEDLALRVYTSRLIGRDPDLVMHGGGNTSMKGVRRTVVGDEVEAIYIKGSGWDLDSIEPPGLPAVALAPLRRLRAMPTLSDEEMVNQLRTNLFDASAPNPSVETLLHVFLPQRFIDHTHADIALVLTNQPHPLGEELCREVFGPRWGVVPYVMPGLALAKLAAEIYERNPSVEGLVLMNHGLFSFGPDARTSYERMIAAIDRAERFARVRARPSPPVTANRVPDLDQLIPLLRGALAEPSGGPDRTWKRVVLERRANDEVLQLLSQPEAASLAVRGPLTPDHIIRTKLQALFLGDLPEEVASLRARIAAAVTAFRASYDAYFETNRGRSGARLHKLDATPRVVLIPGAGIFATGRTKRAARIAADIAEHTVRAKALAERIEHYVALPDGDLFDMEYWSLEQAKLGKAKEPALAGQIALVTGATGAIGFGVCRKLIEAGAHVVATDLDQPRVDALLAELDPKGQGLASGTTMDVTNPRSVSDAFSWLIGEHGGLDIAVLNAGVAHVSPIDTLDLEAFDHVVDVNLGGTFLVLRETARLMKRQDTGGHIILNSSKNVFGPGADFGAYSASKAGAHQLAKVAAIELAPFGIRVNMINADAVFGDSRHPSGLWREVGPARAQSRGLEPEALPEYYRKRNLLKVAVTAEHVGNAVVFFATNQTPTTGATLPVDGGVVEAFPR